MHRKLLSQVPMLILIHFLNGFVMWYGIEKIFLRDEIEIGPSGVAIIAAVYLTLTLLLNVPAGVIADKWGRKPMLICAFGFFAAADIILGVSHDFTMYLIGTVLWALYSVSYAGTYEAILFDSLRYEKREKAFQKTDAFARMFFMVGIAVSSLVSGFIAETVGIREVYYLSATPLLIGIGLMFLLKEPPIHMEDEVEDSLRLGYLKHFTSAFLTIARSSQLRIAAFGTIMLLLILTPLYEFEQYIFIELFHLPTIVGMLNGLAGLALAAGFLVATKKLFHPSVLFIVTIASLGLLSVLHNTISLVFLLLALILAAILENSIQTDMQHATNSVSRASVTSAINFLGSLAVLPFLFLFAAIAEHSIWQAYLLTAVILTVLFIGYVLVVILSEKALQDDVK